MSDTWTGWHWLREDRRLNFPPHQLVEPGQTLRLPDGVQPVPCCTGYHASRRAIDALEYAPGPIICWVTLGGVIVEGGDKACATERTCLWMADAANVLHEFACWCAEGALRAAKVDDPRCWAVIETKRRWLRGEATNEELAAARAEAWAAEAAAGAAARAAARGAQNAQLESVLSALAPVEGC